MFAGGVEGQRAAVIIHPPQRHPQHLGGEETGGALGPFHHTDALWIAQQLFQPQIYRLLDRGDAVKIDVIEKMTVLVAGVAADEDERRTEQWRCHTPADADALREDGLARSQFTFQRDDLASCQKRAQARSHAPRLLRAAADEF